MNRDGQIANPVESVEAEMRMLRTIMLRIALPLFAVGVAAATPVYAESFTYNGAGLVNGQDISIRSPIRAGSEAGGIILNGSGPNAGQQILAWCLDLYNDLNNRGTYLIEPLTGAGSGGRNPTLSQQQIGEIGALMAYGDTHLYETNVSAAIQIAIWTVEYGSSFVYSGISNALATLVSAYVTDVTSGAWAPNTNVSLLSSARDQNLGYLDPTPLPSTWIMMLGGLLGLGLVAYGGARRSELRLA
jgi:hypothetical protein